ncbi:SufBD protein [Anaerolentibacter hominis]|uniref:SufBD protein n=1 Tax=Anaerolentibacter hominis TaxID=3079009 RepID=UPI0031B8938F
MNIPELIEDLQNKDSKLAYHALQELLARSGQDSQVYTYMNLFFDMTDSKNSYVRTRGLLLISANARWDGACKIESKIGSYLTHITDAKPITARQCIKALPAIALYKPALREIILDALTNADISNYADSMQPLICGDIVAVIKEIKSQKD